MNTTPRAMSRRSFLALPALLPLTALASAFPEEYDFQYEGVVGTSMDLAVVTPESHVAESACRTVLEDIDRLSAILDTRNPASEISFLERTRGHANPSDDLREVFAAYNHWERRSGGVFSIRPGGIDQPRNVDALGKAYIIDSAAAAARKAWPSIDSLLLNIGGDIVTWGRTYEIAIADPGAWYDNAEPIAIVRLHNAAIATSGIYARGPHLVNPLTGRLGANVAATVVARDAVTANALATTLCLTSAEYGLQLVESTKGAEALRMESGILQRTSGFALLERPVLPQSPALSSWPQGYRVTISLPLKRGRSSKRPYVAVWVEDSAGKLVRILAVWGNKSKYFADLSTAWTLMRLREQNQLKSVTRATRSAGKYDLTWDGLNGEQKPVPLGEYRITVETNQENGVYAKQSGMISLGDHPASITLPETTNFDPVLVQYGPR